jgi:hypothetical protein
VSPLPQRHDALIGLLWDRLLRHALLL